MEKISPWCPSSSIIIDIKEDVRGGPFKILLHAQTSSSKRHILKVILTLCTTAFSLLLKTTSFLVLFDAGTNARISSPFLLSKIGMLMEYQFNFKRSPDTYLPDFNRVASCRKFRIHTIVRCITHTIDKCAHVRCVKRNAPVQSPMYLRRGIVCGVFAQPTK